MPALEGWRRKSSWPWRLYKEAYVDYRRDWLDGPWVPSDLDHPEIKDLPEVKAFIEQRRLYDSLSQSECGNRGKEEYDKMNILHESAWKAVKGWSEARFEEETALKSRAIEEQLNYGMNRCPFFRGLIIACLIYLPFVRTWKRMKSPLDKALGLIALAVFIFGLAFAGYLAIEAGINNRTVIAEYTVKATTATVAFVATGVGEKIGDVVSERRERKQWEVAHAVEVAEAKKYERQEMKIRNQKEREEMKETFLSILMLLLIGLFAVFLTVFVYIVGYGLKRVAVLLSAPLDFGLTLISKFLAVPADRLWRLLGGPETMERAEVRTAKVKRFVQRVFSPFVRAFNALNRFWEDTWSLLVAYAKAVDEKICPFIEFIDDEEGKEA